MAAEVKLAPGWLRIDVDRASRRLDQWGGTYNPNADVIDLPCPYCKKMNVWPIESQEARGVFVPYCPGGDCEDMHATTL